MFEKLVSLQKGRDRCALWLPGWLLFGCFLLLFGLLHLRSLGWSRGILFDGPPFYWNLIEQIIPPEHLYVRRNAVEALVHRWMLAGGLLALSAAFVLAVLRARRHPQGVRLPSLLKWASLFSLPLLLLPSLLSSDIYSYMIFGRIAAVYDGNPFIDLPARFWDDPYLKYVDWKKMASVYGPTWILFSHGLTSAVEALGGALWLYQLAYKLLAIIPHLLNIVLLWNILGRWKPHQQAWGSVLYGWNPLILIEFAGSAHNDVLMITFLLLALWLHLRQRPHFAIAALVVGMLLKWVVAALIPLYGIMLLWQAPGWRARARLIATGPAMAAAVAVVLYMPYWDGLKTLRILTEAPPATRTINSLGDMLIYEVQYQRFLADEGPHPWANLKIPEVKTASARAVLLPPDDVPFEEQLMRQRRSRSDTEVREASDAIIRTKQMEETEGVLRLAGGALFVLVWLWWACCTRNLESLLRGWAWILFTYVTFTSIWFWPWYLTWFVALAALLDWRRLGVVALIFSVTMPYLYALYPVENPPMFLERYRALLIFGPPLLYLAGTFIVRLFRLRPRDETEANVQQQSSPARSSIS